MKTIKKAQTGVKQKPAAKPKGPRRTTSGMWVDEDKFRPPFDVEYADEVKPKPKAKTMPKKKAQLGGLIKKGLNTAVKSTAKQSVKKKIPKISDDVMEKAMTKAGRADLKAKMKKWDSEMKTGGKVTKAKSGTSMKKCKYGCK